MNNITPLEPGFYGMGIAPKLLDILWQLQYKAPTPIQHKSIPVAVEGKDLIGIAQTGTGKTLAFSVPLIQRLAQTKGRGLVILPTRELALQAEKVIQQLGRPVGGQARGFTHGCVDWRRVHAFANAADQTQPARLGCHTRPVD